MRTIQLALSNPSYRAALKALLAQDAAFQDWSIEPVAVPDLNRGVILVLDSATLKLLRQPLPYPEQIVLVTQNAPEPLIRAWEAGIVSVIFDDEPLSTALLAILAARCRACRFSA